MINVGRHGTEDWLSRLSYGSPEVPLPFACMAWVCLNRHGFGNWLTFYNSFSRISTDFSLMRECDKSKNFDSSTQTTSSQYVLI